MPNKVLLLLFTLVIYSCGSGGSGGGSQTDVEQIGQANQFGQFLYRGAFRVSSATFGESTADYGIGTLAYNPTNHSLFIAGQDQHKAIAEFPIPELRDRPTLAELVEVPARQDFRRIVNEVANPEGIDRITGMLYVNGQLIVNAEQWYDANASNRDTTLVIRDAENLTSSAIDGYYELTGGANAAGYMAPIPPEWQAEFGGAYLTGWSSVYSINGRYSIGPSLFVFDSDNLLNGGANSGPIAATAFMNFPFSGGNWLDPNYTQMGRGGAPALWNLLSGGVFGFIVPGTSTYAVFGYSGGINSGIGYKITQDNGNLCGGHCSYDPADNYNYYWLFDVRDILNASAPHDIQPYAHGQVSVPFDNGGGYSIVGGTFDPDTRMLYLSLSMGSGGLGQSEYTPLIVGYEVELPVP